MTELEDAIDYLTMPELRKSIARESPSSLIAIDRLADAVRRVASLTQDDLLKVIGRAMYGWGPDEPNAATGFTTAADVAEVTDAVWKWLGITEDTE